MSGAPTFRLSDVAGAVKGARAAGLSITRLEIDTAGKIVLISQEEAAKSSATDARTGIIARRLEARREHGQD